MIVYSSNVLASNTIATAMLELGYKDIIDLKINHILDLPVDQLEEPIIVLSPHKSKGEKTLTTHTPGNWNENKYGGSPKTLSKSNPGFMLDVLKNLKKYRDELSIDASVSYEVDHHGPTIDKAITFVELGSNEKHWKDKDAGHAIALAIIDSLSYDQKESYLAVGAGHYAPKFTKLSLEKDIAFAHFLPKYHVDALTFDVFEQAFEKSLAPVVGVMIDKKGLNSAQKKKIIEFSERLGKEVFIV